MSQASISDFFTRKRKAAATGATGRAAASATPAKKQKPTTPGSALTAEQRERIAANRARALALKRKKQAARTDSPSAAADAEADASPAPRISLDLITDPGWKSVLQDQESKGYFKRLANFLQGEYKKKTIYPPLEDVFAAFNLCPWEKVRVVILGQDPYHGPGQAHGLAFSVLPGVRVPPSLRNIYKEAHADVGIRIPQHGHLISWAKQGVLMLNTCLSVQRGKPMSHKKRGWEEFTEAVVRKIAREKRGVVFLLWGKHAESRAACVSTSKHHKISSSHPSPLGATKTKKPFISSRCFSRTNKLLKDQGDEPINWQIK